jgi:hypothetical protein
VPEDLAKYDRRLTVHKISPRLIELDISYGSDLLGAFRLEQFAEVNAMNAIGVAFRRFQILRPVHFQRIVNFI